MTLEEIIAEWKQLSVIDHTKFTYEITRTPMLHARFLEHYIFFKAKLASEERKMSKIKNLKRKYYRGEMDKTELDAQGWIQFQGLKPSSGELNQLFDLDPDLSAIEERLAYWKTGVTAIEYILKQIQSREWGLKAILDYEKFVAG